MVLERARRILCKNIGHKWIYGWDEEHGLVKKCLRCRIKIKVKG